MSPSHGDRSSADNPRKARPPNLTMQEAATQVVRTLHDAGHITYFAGGCVRDMVMGNPPSDYDIATSAEPPQVVALLKRTRQVGAKFGVVLARVGGHDMEIATFRRDMDYVDGRHPAAVQFTDAREDAIRRDFTINGMFYDPLRGEVVDYVGGREDIAARVIRAIGEPDRRFAEDHLRLLRAIRFASRFGFEIEPVTWQAMKTHAPQLVKISPERIREELDQMLSHPGREMAFAYLRDSGLLKYLWPTADRLLPRAEYIHGVLTALPREASFELCLAAMLHDVPELHVGDVCEALRCSNDTKRILSWLVRHAHRADEPDKLTRADLKLLMAGHDFEGLLHLLAARSRASGRTRAAYDELTLRAREIAPSEVAPPPLLTGNDLAEMGVAAGPLYKKVLDCVYYEQLNDAIADREHALRRGRELIETMNTSDTARRRRRP